MAWTYADMKVDDAALGIADPGQAAAALALLTETLPPQVIRKADAREPLLLTGLLAIWERFAAQPIANLAAPTGPEQLVLLVQSWHRVLTLTDVAELDFVDPAKWVDFLGKAQALIANGLLTQDIVDFWTGLRTPRARKYPGVDAGQVQTARAQP